MTYQQNKMKIEIEDFLKSAKWKFAKTIGLIKRPENWEYSSYSEYITDPNVATAICETGELFDLKPEQYKRFVNDNKGYQRDLSIIKSTLIDNYTG